MNQSAQRNLMMINTIRQSEWLQVNRYSVPLNELYLECDTFDQLSIVSRLLTDFKYVSADAYLDKIEMLGEHLINGWGFNPKTTLVSAICDSGRVDGSQIVLGSLRNYLPSAWNNSTASNIDLAFQSNKANIVLVDDFTGTGEKLCPKIIRLKERLHKNDLDQRVYVLSFAGMKLGLDRLRAEVVDLFTIFEMTRAISDDIYDAAEKERATNAMIELERRILPNSPTCPIKKAKFKEYNFGFGRSEAIFFAKNLRTPNNVFPIFWKERNVDGSQRNPLLRR